MAIVMVAVTSRLSGWVLHLPTLLPKNVINITDFVHNREKPTVLAPPTTLFQ